MASSLHASPKLNGIAVHNQLSEDQFIAAVFSETQTNEARSLLLNNEEKVMEIRVLTDTLYARRFKRMWIEGIAINAGAVELEKHAQHLADFSNLLRVKMKAGDILRIERLSGTGTRVTINGYELGIIPSEAFFDLLLRTWVGPVPLSSSFKQNLLAGGNVADELQQRFRSTSPSPERVAAVTTALEAAMQAESESEETSTEEPAAPAADSVAKNEDKKKSGPRADNKPAPAPRQDKPAPQKVADKPKEKEKNTGLITEEALFAEESIFSDDDEDFSFTAEGLLSEQVYIAKLTKWTSSFVSYPRAALKNDQEGTVRITVTIRRNGRVKDVQFLEKSEHDQLNRAAAKAVKSASPYPAVPDTIAGDVFLFTVPVVFRLQ